MRLLLALSCIAVATLASPAQATGGYMCKTADGSEVAIAVGYGHVPGAPLIGGHLWVKDKKVPVATPQWWLDRSELRLVLTDEQAMNTLATVRAEWNDQNHSYDGTVEWQGKKRWIRCYEN